MEKIIKECEKIKEVYNKLEEKYPEVYRNFNDFYAKEEGVYGLAFNCGTITYGLTIFKNFMNNNYCLADDILTYRVKPFSYISECEVIVNVNRAVERMGQKLEIGDGSNVE